MRIKSSNKNEYCSINNIGVLTVREMKVYISYGNNEYGYGFMDVCIDKNEMVAEWKEKSRITKCGENAWSKLP